MEAEFGRRMKTLFMVVCGDVSEEVGKELVSSLTTSLGMSPAPGSSLCTYPANGKGGVGYTIFQPITESFIAFDAWPELGGGYLVVCSCGECNLSAVLKTVNTMHLDARDFHRQVLEL